MAEAKLSIAVDAKKAVKGVDDFGRALSDVVDDMEKVAKEGDVTERALVDNARDISKAFKTEGKDAGKGLGKGIKEGAEEAGSEAASSGREAAASFSGGFDDVADFLQETLANALGGFGPLGAAAGVVLAGILGTALAGAQAAQDKLEEARDRASELAQTLYENKGKLPVEDAISRVLELLPSERKPGTFIEGWIDGLADLGTNMDAVRDASRRSGRELGTFVRGLSGTDLDETARAIEAVQEAIDSIDVGPMDLEGLGQQSQLAALRDQLIAVRDGSKLAQEALGAVTESGLPGSAEYIAQVDAIGTAWQDAMVDADAYVTEAEGVTSFDWSAYLTDAEATLAAANDYKKRILTVPADVRTEAENIFKTSGAKGASAYLKAYEGASTTDKSRFVSAARINGEAAGKAQGEAAVSAADKAAKSKASGLTPTAVPIKPGPINWSSVTRNPPTVYIPGVIVKPGTRQPL